MADLCFDRARRALRLCWLCWRASGSCDDGCSIMASTPHPFAGREVLIVGSGVFGLSTARALLSHATPPRHITIIDRAASLGPSDPAASFDRTKNVRDRVAAAADRR